MMMTTPDGTEEALKLAEDLLADEYAPELSNAKHSWLKHNIARLMDHFATDKLADQISELSNEQVIASLVREYRTAEEAVAATHKTQIAVLNAIITSYQRERV